MSSEENSSGMFGVQGTGDTSGYGGLARSSVKPGSTERPYGSYFDDVADELERAYPFFSDAIERVVVDRGELTLHVKRERKFFEIHHHFVLKCALALAVLTTLRSKGANYTRYTHFSQLLIIVG